MDGLKVGDRVQVKDTAGYVRYKGPTQFQPGEWVGVELDLPVGKNDGSVQGVRYFDCVHRDLDGSGLYGVFARPAIVSLLDKEINEGKPVPSVSNNPRDKRLESIIGKLESKIKGLQENLKTVTDQLAILQSKNSELLNEMENYEGKVENITVDKELIEAQRDELAHKFDELKKSYDDIREKYDLTYEELKISQEIDEELEDKSSEGYKLILKKNKLLESALVKLQDSSQDKENTFQQKLTSLERQLEETSASQENYTQALHLIDSLEKQNVELQEQIASIQHSDHIIESLTSKNLALSTKVEKLEAAIKDLEELNKLNQEMEESFASIQIELNQKIQETETLLRQSKDENISLVEKYKDLEKIIIENSKTKPKHVIASSPVTRSDIPVPPKSQNNTEVYLQRLLKLANENYIHEIQNLLNTVPDLLTEKDHFLLLANVNRVKLLLIPIVDEYKSQFAKELDIISPQTYDGLLLKVTNVHSISRSLSDIDSFCICLSYSRSPVNDSGTIADQYSSFANGIESSLKNERFAFDKLLLDINVSSHCPPSVISFTELKETIALCLTSIQSSVLSIDLILKGLALIYKESTLGLIPHLISLKAVFTKFEKLLTCDMGILDDAETRATLNFSEVDKDKITNLRQMLSMIYETTGKFTSDIGLFVSGIENEANAGKALIDNFESALFSPNDSDKLSIFEELKTSFPDIESIKFSLSSSEIEEKFKWTSSNNRMVQSPGLTDPSAFASKSQNSTPTDNSAHDQTVADLELKISILESKLQKNKGSELELIKSKKELEMLRETEQTLQREKVELESVLDAKEKELNKNRKQRIIGGGDFADVFDKKESADRATLISELGILRNALRRMNNASTTKTTSNHSIADDFKWLSQSFEKSFVPTGLKSRPSSSDYRFKRILDNLAKIEGNYSLVDIDRVNPTSHAKFYTAAMINEVKAYRNFV